VAENKECGIYTRTSNLLGNNEQVVHNTIVAGNGKTGMDVDDADGDIPVDESHNDFHGNGGGDVVVHGKKIALAASDVRSSPGFVGRGDHPYGLGIRSPLRDVGSAAHAPETDICGMPRTGGRPSIGAYEKDAARP
jgi:hypothetical protein